MACRRSVALCKRNGTVVGGITYRAFHELGLGEIAFCAITASEQVKGFGTRLMNYTKVCCWARWWVFGGRHQWHQIGRAAPHPQRRTVPNASGDNCCRSLP